MCTAPNQDIVQDVVDGSQQKMIYFVYNESELPKLKMSQAYLWNQKVENEETSLGKFNIIKCREG